MEIISREDAKKRGLKFYFTGNPCKKGHICERYVSSFTCLEREKLKTAEIVRLQRERRSAERAEEVRNNPDLISRSEAREQGLMFYFTGKACKYNHIAKRRVANGWCYICEQRINSSPQSTQRKRDHYRKNRNRYARMRREYYAKNRDKILTQTSNYQRENRAINRKAVSEWQRRNRAKTAAKCAARRALLRKVSTKLTTAEEAKIQQIYNECARLNESAGYTKYHVDHIIPVSKGGLHHPSNLRVMDGIENRKKGAKLDYKNED